MRSRWPATARRLWSTTWAQTSTARGLTGPRLSGSSTRSSRSAARAGIAALTTIAAEELHRYGVTVNAVSPSALTRMTEGLVELDEEAKQRLAPHWIAPLVTWLASGESRWVTGRVFDLSGLNLS